MLLRTILLWARQVTLVLHQRLYQSIQCILLLYYFDGNIRVLEAYLNYKSFKPSRTLFFSCNYPLLIRDNQVTNKIYYKH